MDWKMTNDELKWKLQHLLENATMNDVILTLRDILESEGDEHSSHGNFNAAKNYWFQADILDTIACCTDIIPFNSYQQERETILDDINKLLAKISTC